MLASRLRIVSRCLVRVIIFWIVSVSRCIRKECVKPATADASLSRWTATGARSPLRGHLSKTGHARKDTAAATSSNPVCGQLPNSPTIRPEPPTLFVADKLGLALTSYCVLQCCSAVADGKGFGPGARQSLYRSSFCETVQKTAGNHSERRATIGSTLLARRAGR